MHELGPGLRRWTASHPAWTPSSTGWGRNVGCVYLETEEALVLVDPLLPPDDVSFWAALDDDVERLGRKVMVILTAPWHVRSTDEVVRRYRASLWAHPAGQERLRRSVDAPVLPRGVEVLEIPPIHDGQVALWVQPHAALVTAEVLAGDAGGLRVCPSPSLNDVDRLRSCLHLLAELPVEIVLPAHGEPVLGRGRDAIAVAIAHSAPSAA